MTTPIIYNPNRSMPDDVEALRFWLQTELDRLSLLAEEINEKFSQQANVRTYAPLKGAMATFEGTGPSDPTLLDSYNVASVTRAFEGIYDITLAQNTINGVDIVANSYPVLTVFAPSAGEATFARFRPSTAAGVLQMTVFQTDLSGQDLLEVPYEIRSGDFVWYLGLLNVQDPDADPVPE